MNTHSLFLLVITKRLIFFYKLPLTKDNERNNTILEDLYFLNLARFFLRIVSK